MASAARHTQRVQVRRMGVSISPELLDLCRPHELAETVAHHHRRGDLLPEDVSAVGQDGGDPGANALPLPHSDLAHQDPVHIRDGVVKAG